MLALEIYIDICLKDALIDYLFEKGFDDFFYVECYKYAAYSLLLSQKEQVSGRKDYAKFKLFLSERGRFTSSKSFKKSVRF